MFQINGELKYSNEVQLAEGHEFHILRLCRYHNDEISLAFVTLRTVEYRSALCSYKIKAIVRDNVRNNTKSIIYVRS